METLVVFAYAVMGGAAVALGGTAYLMVDDRVVGALLFTIGLFAVCTFALNLFTGRVVYVFEKDRRYALHLIPIWLGNFLGAWLTAQAELLTRHGPHLQARALALAQVKLDDRLMSIFWLSVFCNLLVCISVDGFKRNKHELGKYLSILLGVMVFVLCGFEHCVANMYYFTLAGVWSGEALLCLLVMTAGNACGGVILPLLRQWKDKTETRSR